MSDGLRAQLKKLQLEAVKAGKLPPVELQDFIANLYERLEGRTIEDHIAWARERIAVLPGLPGIRAPDSELVVLPAAHLAKRDEPAMLIGRKPGEPRFFLNHADWSLWKKWGRIALVDAILLSVDLDPVTEPKITSTGLEKLRMFKTVLDADNVRRLDRRAQIVLSLVEDLLLDRVGPDPLLARILLRGFGDFAMANKLILPAEFPRSRSETKPANDGKWPWGDYENTLLRHLADAVQLFWAQEEDRQGAALKEEVVKWLRQRGVSKGKADAIALVIRPDDIAPGPRKKDEE